MRISDWSSDVCSSDLLLGTDSVGRDLLSRIIWGARTTYAVVPLSIGSAFLLGISAGMLAGYYGGWLDHLVSRLGDVMPAFPALVLYIILITAVGDRKCTRLNSSH